ncbi:MAG: MBL fold metallo-hydrolase, partial [Chloroflexi bacterium]|nr:MBL fold metallo-hydrolase [Chloroflexota bacterium]
MARLIILGSAAAVSDAEHDNTHFLLQGDNGSVVLVDCGSNPLGKLSRHGIHFDQLTDLVLTHFHPDHVYGVPILLMQMWLLGRKKPLRVYGLHHCLHRVREMMVSFMVETWPNFFPMLFHTLPEHDNVYVLENRDFRIRSWPTRHFIPTVGLRIEVKTSGQVIGYSCDTEPIPGIVSLAHNADLLLHEAAGLGFGHSSAAQAGEIASEAGAKRLALIHYDVVNSHPHILLDEARTTFA